ncbi:MAG TPA: ThuA domain-containing protein [Candidatus Limnocylindrales bacterium]|nr:ThuA domain-containing protein [Candidatus Limnocylindrales bacterium]
MINRRELLRTLGAAALVASARGIPFARTASAKPGKRKKILMFTKSSGYEHSMVHRADGKLAPAEQTVTDMGKEHGFEVTATKDGGVFSSPDLTQYDAFFFYTTGDLTTPGTDKNPPMTPEGKQAFLNLIHEGKGFIGTHSATDTFDTYGDRFDPKPQPLDPYLQMIGAEFLAHDAQQKARITVADKKFPGMEPLGDGIEITEEWYPFRDFQPNLHVLTVLETAGMQGLHYQRPPYPNTWARMHGRGRVFYTALGHREDVWAADWYRSMLLGGISWALRDVDADVTPNISRVAPHANDIPAGAFAHPH